MCFSDAVGAAPTIHTNRQMAGACIFQGNIIGIGCRRPRGRRQKDGKRQLHDEFLRGLSIQNVPVHLNACFESSIVEHRRKVQGSVLTGCWPLPFKIAPARLAH